MNTGSNKREKKESKNEDYFQSLIGGIIESYYISDQKDACYKVFVEKMIPGSKKAHGRLDSIFYPYQNKTLPLVIHEYQLEYETQYKTIAKAHAQVFWRILEQNYLQEALGRRESYPESHLWEDIKLRSMVFIQNSNSEHYSIQSQEKSISVMMAKSIIEFMSSSKHPSARQQYLLEINIHELIDTIKSDCEQKTNNNIIVQTN